MTEPEVFTPDEERRLLEGILLAALYPALLGLVWGRKPRGLQRHPAHSRLQHRLGKEPAGTGSADFLFLFSHRTPESFVVHRRLT
jgi:hypothetical protein